MSQAHHSPFHTCHFIRDGPCAACEAAQRGLRAVQQQIVEARLFLDGEFENGNMEPVRVDDQWLRLIGAAIAYGRESRDTQDAQDGAEVGTESSHRRFGFIELEASTERR